MPEHHDVTAFLPELVGKTLDLIHAVGLVVHRHDERERRTEFGQHGGQVNLSEVINEQVGGRGAAVHDNEVRLFKGGEDSVQFAAIVQVQKPRVGMKPFQRRVFVVGINRDMGNALVLEELDKVHREEAFADAALAVKDENETFHVLSGLSIRTCAMRGPRLRGGWISRPLASVAGSCDVEAAPPFGSAGRAGRFRAGRLRGRTISEST